MARLWHKKAHGASLWQPNGAICTFVAHRESIVVPGPSPPSQLYRGTKADGGRTVSSVAQRRGIVAPELGIVLLLW